MDPVKTGRLIFRLRREQGLTQLQLAEALGVSDKAVSKWERGLGCPDVSLLGELSRLLAVDLERLLCGELGEQEVLGGNMKKTVFYVCPGCGNIMTAAGEASVSCCGKKLSALQAQKAQEGEGLCIEPVENELFITSSHPMEKEHYLSFVALLSGDRLLLCRQYPEWGLQLRLPAVPRGKLFWYCTRHGLFWQEAR